MSGAIEATEASAWGDTGVILPALFVGHGSPMNAIEDNEFSQAWAAMGRSLPRPRAILCISAHWETTGTQVTAVERPRTIHDFAGFPPALFEVDYPAPGCPDLARWLRENLDVAITPDFDWGIDHGAWSVLGRMFPEADVPVLQLSLDRSRSPAAHYALGKALRVLRGKGVLILGSGNIAHNLRTVVWKDVAHNWAIAFDEKIRDLIMAGDHDSIIHWDRLGETARLAVPTPEHFLPLLYILALHDPEEPIAFFTEKVTLGSIAMRSLWVG
jgi:4,5-DOPA dioxygenase extradiol